MVTTFDERERAFENRFVHDEEVRFRVRTRRDRAVSAWVAAQIGLEGASATAYQDTTLAASIAGADDAALAQRFADDLARAGRSVDVAGVRAEMDRQMAVALERERTA